MAYTPLHTVAGVSIVKIIPDPVIGCIAAFISHFIVDLYPEYSISFKDKIYRLVLLIEGILMLWIISIVCLDFKLIYLSGAIASNIPDLWDAINVIRKKRRFWCCHPGGWFPISSDLWVMQSMKVESTIAIDTLFIALLLMMK